VAVLVLPAPQNLLMHKQALDTLPANAAPVDSLLLVARYLGELRQMWWWCFFTKCSLTLHPLRAVPAVCCCVVLKLLSVVGVSAEALGEHCTDGNSQYFTALSLQQQDIPQLRHWTTVYPLGTFVRAVTPFLALADHCLVTHFADYY
jgi:hypothetical protein